MNGDERTKTAVILPTIPMLQMIGRMVSLIKDVNKYLQKEIRSINEKYLM